MKSYSEFIKKSRLVQKIDSCVTTGDLEYEGTALEINDESGKELFHVVLGPDGDRQVLFMPQVDQYRMPLDLLEKIIAVAKAKVDIPK